MGFFGGLIGKAVVGGILGGRQKRRQKANISNQFNLAREETPAEKEYRIKLEKESKFGDEDINQKRQELYNPIFSYGQSAKADATGVAIRQGLENSIIASEIKNKIDAKTYQMISEQADKIMKYNEQYKKNAENKLMDYKIKRDARLRDLAVGEAQAMSQLPSSTDALLSMGGSLLDSYMQSNLPWSTDSGSSLPDININLGGNLPTTPPS